ncbi:MAG: hypothetical protein WCQ32_01335 [bacterium]
MEESNNYESFINFLKITYYFFLISIYPILFWNSFGANKSFITLILLSFIFICILGISIFLIRDYLKNKKFSFTILISFLISGLSAITIFIFIIALLQHFFIGTPFPHFPGIN